MFFPHIKLNRKTILLFLIIIFSFSITASLIVLNYSNPVNKIAKTLSFKCKNNSQWSDCYAQVLSALVTKDSLPRIRILLKELQTIDPKANDCHYIAHKIAWKIVEKNPDDPFLTLNYFYSDECAGGFIHGTIEGLKRHDPNFSLSPDIVNKVCSKMLKQNSSSETHEACTHAFGHIILVEYSGSLDQSLSLCKQLGINSQYNCFTGVFMESVTRENLVAHGLLPPLSWDSTTTGKQINICNGYSEGRITQACWEEISHMLVIGRKYNLDKSYSPCNLAKSQESRKTCITHASQLLIASPYITNEQIPLLCSPLTVTKDHDYCIKLTLKAALLTSNSNANSTKVKILCHSLDSKKCEVWINEFK